MTHTARFTSLVLLATVCACDSSPAPDACENVTLRRLAANGRDMNGIRLQGYSINGREMNGSRLQGISLNGRDINGIRLHGTRLVGLDDAPIEDILVGTELPARLVDGRVVSLRVEAIRNEGDLFYYVLTFEGENICGEGLDGLFVEGNWEDDGDRVEDAEFPVAYSCTTGVIAKCVAWGYRPWTVGADVHQSCTRMARADYCGDGTPYTRDGTEIDMFDSLGVQVATHDEAFEFEAAWGPDGATCVSRPRYDESVIGQGEVLPACWAALPLCDDFEEARDVARAQGLPAPVLANASVPQSRLICGPR